MERSDQIEFVYPPIIGSLMVWVGLPLIGLIIVLIIAAGISAVVIVESQSSGIFSIRVEGIAVLGIGLWFGASFVQWFRHRHAFRTRYVLTEQGGTIEPPEAPQRHLMWSDFDYAVDKRLLRYIHLVSPQVKTPVTLMFGTPGSPSLEPTQKFKLVRDLVAAKLGSRVRREWW